MSVDLPAELSLMFPSPSFTQATADKRLKLIKETFIRFVHILLYNILKDNKIFLALAPISMFTIKGKCVSLFKNMVKKIQGTGSAAGICQFDQDCSIFFFVLACYAPSL